MTIFEQDKISTFIDDKDAPFESLLEEMSLDDLFSEANSCIGAISKNTDTTDDTITKLSSLLEDDSSRYVNDVGRVVLDSAKEMKNTINRRTMTKDNREKIREQQLAIVQKLHGESLINLNRAKNNKVVLAAANNPKQFAMLNQNSITMIPRDMRSSTVTDKSLLVGASNPNNTDVRYDTNTIMEQPSEGKFNVASIAKGVAKNPMKLYSYYFMSSALLALFLMLGKTIFSVLRFVTNALSGNHIANSLMLVPSRITKDTMMDMLTKAKVRGDDGLIHWISTNIGATSEAQNKYFEANRLFINPDGTRESTAIINIPYGSRSENYINFNQSVSSFRYGLSTSVKYVAIAAAIAACNYILYKYVSKKVTNNKKEQYATVHSMTQESVTIDMLQEGNDYNKAYYCTLVVLDEGIGDFFKKIAPTPTNILKLINKGIIGAAALAKVTEEGLRSDSISPLLGRVCNFFIAISNIVLLVAKGIMIGIISVVNGKTSNASEMMKTMAQ